MRFLFTLHLIAILALVAEDQTFSLASTSEDGRVRSFMDPSLWQPAGSLLSSVFPGTDASWLTSGSDVWTLPGSSKERDMVMHRGQSRPNHMQYSVTTLADFDSFKLSFGFKFEPESLEHLPLSWFGNSGIYIFGLYEIQIFNTGVFGLPKYLSTSNLPEGNIQVQHGTRREHMPINQLLCGAIYGGGVSGDSFSGAPMDAEGYYVNLCEQGGWHQIEIAFIPAVFNQHKKTACAVVSVTMDGQVLLYDGKPYYVIPGPTGSQRNKPELIRGPITIQDHGSKVSFNNLMIDTQWRPHVTRAMQEDAQACANDGNH